MKKKETCVYQFKITLQDVKPVVWRRIRTPAGYSFWDFHVAIQDAMGWNDVHLHEFRILEPSKNEWESIGIPDDEAFVDDKEVVPGWKRSISNYFSGKNPTAKYVYDFGDDWNHEIILEELMPSDNAATQPVCIEGKGACPPEDCGGPTGYAEFLRAIKKPGSPRGGELLEWVGGSFDPRGFEVKDVTFDDPAGRWSWTFSESVVLDNEVTAMQSSPRKPDRYGRVAFQIPLSQYQMVLKHPGGLNSDVREQFDAAVVKNELATVRLDLDELKAFGGYLKTGANTMQRCLNRRVMMGLCQHFRMMESLVRQM